MIQSDNKHIRIDTVGLLLSKDYPYLGASLDGIAVDLVSGQKWGIEVKCPISKHNMTMEEAMVVGSTMLNQH